MAFIQYLDDSALPEANRVPDTDNILRIHGVHPEVMRQHYDLYVEVMRGAGPLSRRTREMLAVRVSVLNQCRY